MVSPEKEYDDQDSDAPFSLKVFADLNLTLGDVRDQLKRFRHEQARLAAQPNIIPLEQMAQPGAATSAVVDMGSPPDGRTWIVRVLIAAAVPLAANTTVTTWYVGQNIGGPAAGMLVPTWIRWQLPAIGAGGAQVQTFTSNTIQILPRQHLLAGLTTVPAASSIALVAVVNDLPLHGPLSVVSGD